MREASFLYAELVTMGAPMGFCDVGGGLAVDYEARLVTSRSQRVGTCMLTLLHSTTTLHTCRGCIRVHR